MKKIYRIPKFKIQFSGHGRRETIDGKQYAVYPAVMLVEGVHHGAIGSPVFYPASVIEASAVQWEGMPVPIHHPQDNSGEYVLCSDDGVTEEWSVGFLRNSRYEGGKLKAEVCVDVELVNERHPELLAELDVNNPPMEVSTGLLAVDDGVAGIWNDEEYSSSITAIYPDHLALLPGSRGACSHDDGCGIRANKKEAVMKKIKTSALLLMLSAEAGGKLPLQPLMCVNAMSHSEVYSKLSAHVDSLDVRNGDGNYTKMHYVREVYDDFFVYTEISDGEYSLFKQEYELNADDELVLGESITPVREKTDYIPAAQHSNEEEAPMKRKKANSDTDAPCCPEKVEALITNEGSAFVEADRDFLGTWNNDQLDKALAMLQEAPELDEDIVDDEPETVVNTTVQNMTDWFKTVPENVRSVVNAGLKALDVQRAKAIATIKANAANTFTDEQLKLMPPEQLESIATLAAIEEPTAAALGGGAFLGQGGGSFQANDGDTVVEPYVMQTLSFGGDEKGAKK